MSGNKAQDNSKEPGKCGAKNRSGNPCRRPAGWGTDHPGSGRCKLHGGLSTGPKSPEGKKKIAANAIKHGAYSDKLLSEHERDLYSVLWDSTIQKHSLDQEDAMQMATLQRACITYIKMIRLDEWEMEEEIEAITDATKRDPETGKEELIGQNIYNDYGEIIGKRLVKLRRLQWNKTPNWEGHFQRYMQLLGIDRGTQLKLEGAQAAAGTVADAVSWLWGGKSVQEG
jgi:hypothetical protein